MLCVLTQFVSYSACGQIIGNAMEQYYLQNTINPLAY